MQKLFAFHNIEDQRRFIREEWDTKAWKKAFEFSLHPWMTRLFLQDPGLYEYLGQKIKPATYIRERMNASLSRVLARENLLVSLVLLGKVCPEGYPPYLKEQPSEKIKKGLGKICTVDSEIVSCLEQSPANHFDAFSLSDVASFISKEQFGKLLKEMIRTARPNARFCIRQFMSDYFIPKELNAHFQRESTLETQLEEEDRCFVYRFMVGQISK